MNEIKKLFQEVKDHEYAMESFKRFAQDIEACRKKIHSLEFRRQEVGGKITNWNIEEIEAKLKDVRSKIAQIELKDTDVVDISSLTRLVDCSIQGPLVAQKIMLFINRYVCIYAKNCVDSSTIQTLEMLISRYKQTEDTELLEKLLKDMPNTLALVVNKSVETLLNMLYNTELYHATEKILKKRIGVFVQRMNLEAFEVFEYSTLLIFCSSMSDEGLSCQYTECSRISPEGVLGTHSRVSNIFQGLVRDKMVSMVQSGSFSYDVLLRFADRFQTTPLSMGNVENWTLDVLVKELIRVSKHGDGSVQICCDSGAEVRCYAKAAEDIRRIYYKISENSSPRTLKAVEISIKGVQKYIHRLAQVECLEDMLLAFNSTVFIGNEATNTDLLKVCSDMKELIFRNIMDTFAVNPSIHGLDVQDTKLDIKRRAYEFCEATSKLLDAKRARVFKIAFFDVSFSNFIQWILGHEKIRSEDAGRQATIGEYMMSQCTLPPKEIANHRKMMCINIVLLNNPAEKYRRKSLESLTTSELLKLSEIMPWNANLRSFVATRLK